MYFRSSKPQSLWPGVAVMILAFCITTPGWTSAAMAGTAYVDVAGTVGLNFVGTYGPTFPSLSPMWALIQRNMGNGAAVGDYDGDGDLDIYLLGQLGLPNQLFRNELDLGVKAFTDVTASTGVGDMGLSRVAHFVDLDNDGRLDLILLNDDEGTGFSPRSKIYRNNGDGTFTDVSMGSNFQPIGYLHCGMSVADYDQDGLPDIYVSNWGAETGSGIPKFPGSNRLYHNLGQFVFADVTQTAGLGVLARDSFTSIFHDFNNDLFPDLYVAIDHTVDEFYWNQAGTFAVASTAVNIRHLGNDMGAACADFDDDGDLDIYTTNITDPGGDFGNTQNNCFYTNQFDTTGTTWFVDEALSRGVGDTYWGWGVQFVDVENDGDLDLVAVTGFDEFVLSGAGPQSPVYHTPTVLFVNDATGNFSRFNAPGLGATDDSRGLIAFDYDRDGDQDLLITNVNQPVRLLENITTPQGHWLDVSLVQATGQNRDGIGATVYATIAGKTLRRDLICARSYLAGTPLELHFGLGAASTVDQLRIRWTNGSESLFQNIQGDRLITISQIPGDCNASGSVDAGDLGIFVDELIGVVPVSPCLTDLNGDGISNAIDIQAFVSQFLTGG